MICMYFLSSFISFFIVWKLTFFLLKKGDTYSHLIGIVVAIPFFLFNYRAWMNGFIPIFDVDISDSEFMFYFTFVMAYAYAVPYMLAYRKYVKVR